MNPRAWKTNPRRFRSDFQWIQVNHKAPKANLQQIWSWIDPISVASSQIQQKGPQSKPKWLISTNLNATQAESTSPIGRLACNQSNERQQDDWCHPFHPSPSQGSPELASYWLNRLCDPFQWSTLCNLKFCGPLIISFLPLFRPLPACSGLHRSPPAYNFISNWIQLKLSRANTSGWTNQIQPMLISWINQSSNQVPVKSSQAWTSRWRTRMCKWIRDLIKCFNSQVFESTPSQFTGSILIQKELDCNPILDQSNWMIV